MEATDHNGGKREKAVLEWIQQFAPYGVITLDKALRVQSWNHWMETHSGMSFESVAAKNLIELFPDLQVRNLASAFERALEGQASVLSTSLHRYLLPLPSPLHKGGGEQMQQTARIAPLIADEVVCGVVVVIEDVTQREFQAEALRAQHRRDQMLAWALAHLLEAEEPRKIVRQIFFKIVENLDFDTFCLYLRDIETGHLKLYTTGGVPKDLEDEFAEHPFFFEAAESTEPLILNSVGTRSDPPNKLLKRSGIGAAVALPLRANNRSLGLLCFGTWSRDTIAIGESDFLKTLSQYLATAVDRENSNAQLRKTRAQLYEHSLSLERRVEERTARLQDTVSELETFSYTLAHDMKAPVRGMTGYCKVLLEDFHEKIPPGASILLKRLLRSSQRMELLIRDLLAFSRISRDEIQLAPVELGPVIEDLLALRLPAVREATTVHHSLPSVRANRALLQQVLSNLVDNAVKFVEPGMQPKITISGEILPGISPSTRTGPLLFSSSGLNPADERSQPSASSGKYVRIWVMDEGIGIPEELHEKIFNIFERGTTSEVYEGTGMGLAIVARAAQRMGGTCGVESEIGKGSRFWIELPLA